MTTASKDLWTCPKCGAKFVNRHQWHSCGQASLEDWLKPLGPSGRALYRSFEAMIASFGEYHVGPAKTRIAFLGEVRFAGITKLTDDAMVCGFSLPYELDSSRFISVREVAPGWFLHTLRVTSPADLDPEAVGWFLESYRLMGNRERLMKRETEALD
jgi:hypothetical protein